LCRNFVTPHVTMGQFGQIDVSHQKLENLQDCLKEHLKTQLLQEPAFYVNVNS